MIKDVVVVEKRNGWILCDEEGMVVGEFGWIEGVVGVVVSGREEFEFVWILGMIVEIVKEFGKGGK